MKILHVINRYWPAPGGAERHLQEYAERQVRDGHEVTVFTTEAHDLEYFWDRRHRRIERHRDVHKGVRIERFPVYHPPPNSLRFRLLRRGLGELDRLPLTTPILRRLCAETPPIPDMRLALHECAGRYDVVHGMNLAFEALLLPALTHARAARAPFLISPLVHLGESPRSVVRRYYTMKHQIDLVRRADVVLTQTPSEIAYLKGRGVDPERMVNAGAGVDPAAATGGDGARFRRAHGIEGPIVFGVGAMHRDKGTPHVVQAMELLWQRGVDATLVLAGPVMTDFERFLARRAPTTRSLTKIVGYLDESSKRDLFAAGDVFAQTSRTDSFGIVFMEAWLNGTPVVAANIPGVNDVVQHERTGLLVRYGDVPATAAAIERLLCDRAEAAALAARGAARTHALWTWDKVYERVRPAFEHGRVV